MKNSFLILFCLVAVTVLFVSCNSPNVPTTPNQTDAASSSLDEEAKSEVKKQYLDTYFTQCGDSYYTGQPDSKIHRLKDVSIDVKAWKLNDVDKSNGIVWKGDFSIQSSARRDYREGKWEDWKPDDSFSFRQGIEKRETWKLFLHDMLRGKKINCSDIPG